MNATKPSEDETKGQERIRKQLERVGIAPAVDNGVEPVVRNRAEQRPESCKLDVSDTRSFLGQPPPKVGMIQCYILREKSNIHGNKYSLYLEDKDLFLLSSVKRKHNKTSNYLISLDKEDLNRDSGHFYGKLRANFVGTEFTVFDKGEKPNREGEVQGLAPRQEIGGVIYERNILGTKGPRKMCVLVPYVDDNGKRTPWKPEKEEDGLIGRFKKGNTRDMIILKNKEPSWNEQLRAYVLNFSGRVTMPSVKNFQLVDQDNPSKVLMQFGKVDTEKFTLDFQYPISGLQAFGIALSAFDGKLACE
jgi:tubby-related protein 1